jgi:hypothetical protein
VFLKLICKHNSRKLFRVVHRVSVRVSERPCGEYLVANLARGRHRLPLVHRLHVDLEGGGRGEVLAANLALDVRLGVDTALAVAKVEGAVPEEEREIKALHLSSKQHRPIGLRDSNRQSLENAAA